MEMKDYDLMKENIGYYRKVVRQGVPKYNPEIPISLINESQRVWMEVGKMSHYLDFTDAIFSETWDIIEYFIPKTMAGKVASIPITTKNEYFINLTVVLRPYYSWKPSEITLFNSYAGECNLVCGFIDKKLINPEITLHYPIHCDGLTIEGFIKESLKHSLTLIYDEASRRRTHGDNNVPPLILNNERDILLFDIFDEYDVKVATDISDMVYMHSATKEKFFFEQVMRELEKLECNDVNYREKVKNTFRYRNISEMLRRVKDGIIGSDESDLSFVNKNAIATKSSIPKMYDDFNTEEYRKKLLAFMGDVCRDYLKRYYSIVMYYLTAWKGGHRVPKTGKTTFDETYYYP